MNHLLKERKHELLRSEVTIIKYVSSLGEIVNDAMNIVKTLLKTEYLC